MKSGTPVMLAATLCLLMMIQGQAEGRYKSEIRLLLLKPELIRPESVMPAFWDLAEQFPDGEIFVQVYPDTVEGRYFPDEPAAFVWRLSGNVFAWYSERLGQGHWVVYKGRNVLVPPGLNVKVEFALYTWVRSFPGDERFRRVKLVIPQLPELSEEEIRSLAAYYESVLPGAGLRLTIGNSLMAACLGLELPLGVCPLEKRVEPDSLDIDYDTTGTDNILSIDRGGRRVQQWTIKKPSNDQGSQRTGDVTDSPP